MAKAQLIVPTSKTTNEEECVVLGLDSIDWDFINTGRFERELIHPYPARFIPEIPSSLLDCLPLQQGTVVFDPFCGSGTTLEVAQRRGLPSVGIDVNPIACLISRVRTRALPHEFLSEADRAVSNAMGNSSPKVWDIPNLNHWFKCDIQAAISALLESIKQCKNECHEPLYVALSAILVRVSNQDSDTRYAAVKKSIEGKDVFTAFRAAVTKIHKLLSNRDWPAKEFTPTIIEGNTIEIQAEAIGVPVGLVITSPPYPNAYEYWLYHKYRMWWLGYDPIRTKKAEIGARAHFFKREHHTEETFRQQMTKTLELINSTLVPGGYACFVIGRSKIHGRIVDNAQIILEVAKAINFSKIYSTERTISSTRKSFNLNHAKIKNETILVLRKQ